MRSSSWTGSNSFGAILIAIGLVFLVAQTGGFEMGRYGWPLIIVAIGLGLLVVGLSGVDPSRGSIYPGMIVTTVGGVLLYQNTFHSEILVEGGHVGIVVGRTAKTDLWPRVTEWLARHD